MKEIKEKLEKQIERNRTIMESKELDEESRKRWKHYYNESQTIYMLLFNDVYLSK